VSRKEETEILKDLLKELSENLEVNERSRKGFKSMLRTVEAAKKDGIYLSYEILRKYYDMITGIKNTEDYDIDTIYTCT
jgi:hypothetical protein